MARHLGVMVERRPGRREPEDVDMADEDVAALLMSLPMDNGCAARHLRPLLESSCPTFNTVLLILGYHISNALFSEAERTVESEAAIVKRCLGVL